MNNTQIKAIESMLAGDKTSTRVGKAWWDDTLEVIYLTNGAGTTVVQFFVKEDINYIKTNYRVDAVSEHMRKVITKLGEGYSDVGTFSRKEIQGWKPEADKKCVSLADNAGTNCKINVKYLKTVLNIFNSKEIQVYHNDNCRSPLKLAVSAGTAGGLWGRDKLNYIAYIFPIVGARKA